MRTASAQPYQRTSDALPTGGFTLSKIGACGGAAIAGGGRPESETDTPVNIENGLYCDNGEGVASRPLPYPLGDASRSSGFEMVNAGPDCIDGSGPIHFEK
jgi:hypothetical protein